MGGEVRGGDVSTVVEVVAVTEGAVAPLLQAATTTAALKAATNRAETSSWRSTPGRQTQLQAPEHSPETLRNARWRPP